MQTARALALGLADRSPFASSDRPQGSGRTPKGDARVFALIRSFRNALAQGLDEPAAGWVPKLARYPY
jgi:hypothetical protein